MNAAMGWKKIYKPSSGNSILHSFVYFLHSFEDFGQVVFGLGSSSFAGFGSCFWSLASFFLFAFLHLDLLVCCPLAPVSALF